MKYRAERFEVGSVDKSSQRKNLYNAVGRIPIFGAINIVQSPIGYCVGLTQHLRYYLANFLYQQLAADQSCS